MLLVKAVRVYCAFWLVECGKSLLDGNGLSEEKGACHDYKYALTYMKVATGDISCPRLTCDGRRTAK